MNERTYTRFVPQEDNANDVIQAEDINELQRGLEKVQEESFHQADMSFLNRALFALEHHPDANAMIVELFEDEEKIDQSSGVNASYDPDTRSVGLDSDMVAGSIKTKMIFNLTNKPFTKMILLADEYKPAGTDIAYEISYDGQTYYPLQANQALPFTPPQPIAQCIMRIKFTRMLEGAPSPRVDAWAWLYQDETYMFKFLDDGLTIDIESDWDGTIVK